MLDIGEVEKKFRAMEPRTYKTMLDTLRKLKIPYERGMEVVHSITLGDTNYDTCRFSIAGVEYTVFDNAHWAWRTSNGIKGYKLPNLVREIFYGGDKSKIVQFTGICQYCREVYPKTKGANQHYCGKKCYFEGNKDKINAARRKRRADKNPYKTQIITCARCGKEFNKSFYNKIYCSEDCHVKDGNKKKLELYYKNIERKKEKEGIHTTYVPKFYSSLKQALRKKELILKEAFLDHSWEDSKSEIPRKVNRYAYGKAYYKASLTSLFRRGFMEEKFICDNEDEMYYDFTDLGLRFFSTVRLLEMVAERQPLQLSKLEIVALRHLLSYGKIIPSRLYRYGLNKAFSTLLQKKLASLISPNAYYLTKENLKALHKYLFTLARSLVLVDEILSPLFPLGKLLEDMTSANDALKEHLALAFVNADLLGNSPETIKNRYNKLVSLKISPEKIIKNSHLLNRDPKTIQKHYKDLTSLGISLKQIDQNAQLLGYTTETIQKRYDNLISLGISPWKEDFARLLGHPIKTTQIHYNNLINLGISPKQINQSTRLLIWNPDTIQNNYEYLSNVIKLEENKILATPQLLLCNPDAFTKKLRILKLNILGLKRYDAFNPNEYANLYSCSPATLLAKKNYYARNNIDFLNKLTLLKYSWKIIIKRVNNALDDADVEKEERKIALLYKLRYDSWMKEYKKWCSEFYRRRGRRIILNF